MTLASHFSHCAPSAEFQLQPDGRSPSKGPGVGGERQRVHLEGQMGAPQPRHMIFCFLDEETKAQRAQIGVQEAETDNDSIVFDIKLRITTVILAPGPLSVPSCLRKEIHRPVCQAGRWRLTLTEFLLCARHCPWQFMHNRPIETETTDCIPCVNNLRFRGVA